MLTTRQAINAALMLTFAAVALGQVPPPSAGPTPAVTSDLDIHLTGGPKCKNVETMWVVMDGFENEMFSATADRAEACHWTARRSHTFDAGLASFSLRLNRARTGCQSPEIDTVNGKTVAKLNFRCCRAAMHDVELRTEPEVAVTYTRTLSKNVHDPLSVPCHDSAAYDGDDQPVLILSVWASETLRLPPRSGTNASDAAGETLRVDFGERGLRKREPLLIFNDASVTQYLDPKDDTLTVEQLLAAAREQRCKGKAAAPAQCSTSADDIERAYLKNIRLSRVKVTLAK